jgi:hypothetical protein
LFVHVRPLPLHRFPQKLVALLKNINLRKLPDNVQNIKIFLVIGLFAKGFWYRHKFRELSTNGRSSLSKIHQRMKLHDVIGVGLMESRRLTGRFPRRRGHFSGNEKAAVR